MIVLFLNSSTSGNETIEVPPPSDSTAALESPPPAAVAAARSTNSEIAATQQSLDVHQEQVLESELFKES